MTPFCVGSGYTSVVVDSSQDLSVVVEQVGSNRTSAYSGIQPNPHSDPLWAGTGITLTLPYVYKNYYGYTSEIRLLNTAAVGTHVLWCAISPTQPTV